MYWSCKGKGSVTDSSVLHAAERIPSEGPDLINRAEERRTDEVVRKFPLALGQEQDARKAGKQRTRRSSSGPLPANLVFIFMWTDQNWSATPALCSCISSFFLGLSNQGDRHAHRVAGVDAVEYCRQVLHTTIEYYLLRSSDESDTTEYIHDYRFSMAESEDTRTALSTL